MANPVADKYQWEKSAHYYNGVRYSPRMPAALLDDIKKMDFLQGDILVSSYMKSGTTWLAQIVDLLQSGINIERAKGLDIRERAPFIDLWSPPYGFELVSRRKEGVDQSTVIKTHLPPDFFERHLADGSLKVVYVYRNPKDVLVSYYNMVKIFSYLSDYLSVHTWEDMIKRFEEDALIYGNSVDHVLKWRKYKDYPNVLLVSYEEMKSDHFGQVKKIGEFLGYKYTDAQYEAVVKETTFDVMKKNSAVNYTKHEHASMTGDRKFMRKGKVGDWANHFTEEQNKIVDAIISEKLKNSDLKFQF